MQDEPVVVHFADGRTISGYGDDLLPSDSDYTLRDAASDQEVLVHLRQVKVVCFVRSHATTGVVRNREQPPLVPHAGAGRRAEMVFRDGEHLAGLVSLQDNPTRGFYLVPLNPNGNNIKIYVNPNQLVKFRFVT